MSMTTGEQMPSQADKRRELLRTPIGEYWVDNGLRTKTVADLLKGTDYALVPREPTEAMWSGLARDIVMWTRLADGRTARGLFRHLERVGREIPQWLRDEPELQSLDAVPSKGTVAVIIYRAMIDAIEAGDE